MIHANNKTGNDLFLIFAAVAQQYICFSNTHTHTHKENKRNAHPSSVIDGIIDRDGDCSFPLCEEISSRREFVVDFIGCCCCCCCLLRDVNEADNGKKIAGNIF
jgi:hypothetical protein